ncbi:alpha/beta hydrolase fold domain-containing protein [Plantibacter sp. YIM 135347]|uniref:alpha/beta hydrolase n=1 Tax=Plantibacter sp. YIM 135347 TaxID=3423919 RepID=UPI003D327166
MPLDPIFSERLRTHRKYLISTALEQAKAFLLHPRGGAQAAQTAAAKPTKSTESTKSATSLQSATGSGPAPVGGTGATADPAGPATSARAPKPTVPANTPKAPRKKKTRASHRKAALNWDKKELQTIGTPGPRVLTVEHMVSVDRFPDVRVRIYYPGTEVTTEHPVPGVLSFFGGAFRIGGIDYPTTDAAFRRRAADAGVAIVAVDYALAPEHRYPTQVEQSFAALVWLFAEAESLGVDPTRIAVAGISAGANIAAAVTIVNRERDALPIALQVLEVPVVDLTGKHIDLKPVRAMHVPSILAIREMRSVAKTYLPSRSQAKDPHASPLLAASHVGLPPAVILTAEFDPLRGDGAAYTAALRAAGVDASATQYLGVTHDASIFTGVLPAARRWHADVVTALRSLHP